MTELPPAPLFPPATEADWLKRVAATLKGERFEDKLVSTTDDGIRIDPLYGQAAGPRAARRVHGPWTVMQRADHGNAAIANEQILDDLQQGASGITLTFAGAAAARGFGLGDASVATIGKALRHVALHAIALRLEAGALGRSAALSVAELVRKSAVNPELLDVSFGVDPIGALAQRGFAEESWSERSRLVGSTVAELAKDFRGPFLSADGRVWHDGGATVAQEIGAVLASGAAYLRAIEGCGPEVMGRGIDAVLAADQDMFMTLAKFRAMRLVWSRLFDACGISGELNLHGESSWRMMTRLDPHTNILRGAAAVFGAGLGGADSMTVLPFSLAQGLPNQFARRVARNTQAVLLEESNLWRVDDPAAGSGYVEHVTQSLCERAWAFFREIERQGGIAVALERGWLQEQIGTARTALLAKQAPIIGTSAYRLEKEYEAAVEMMAPKATAMDVRALTPMRIAEGMEGLSTQRVPA